MASDLQIQGEVVVNSEQAESAFNRVGDKAQQMANEVATSAGKAGQAVDKIGDGAGASAEKFTRAESRISASIKRATNELELLGKTASQRLEFNIADKGLDPKKFEPMLQRLREVEQRAREAERAATGSLDNMGMSAKATAAAMRGVPAQFQDIIVSLQGGQAPMTVLLQQGSQLSGLFGGVGNAAKALGTYIVGLVNPLTIAAAAVAGLGVAMYSLNGKDAALRDLSVQLTGTGRASAAAVGDIKVLVNELNTVPGVSKAAATAIIGEFAKVSGLGANLFKDLGASVADFAAATGTDLPTAAKKLAEALADPEKGAKALEESLGTLTAAQILNITKMAEMGDKSGAQAALLDALKQATEGLAKQGMTPLGEATDKMSNAWDKLTTSVGNSSAFRTANDWLAKLIEKTAELTVRLSQMQPPTWLKFLPVVGPAIGAASLLAGTDNSGGSRYVSGKVGNSEGGATGSWGPTADDIEKQVKAALDLTRSYESQSAAMEKLRGVAKVANDALKALEAQSRGNSVEAKELRERIAGVNEKLAEMAKKGGAAPKGGDPFAADREAAKQWSSYVEKFTKAAAEATAKTEGLTKSQAELVEYLQSPAYTNASEPMRETALQAAYAAIAQEQLNDATKQAAKVAADAAKSHAQFVLELSKGASAAEQQAEQLRMEEEAAAIAETGYYSLAQAIELVTIKRLEEQQKGMLGNEDAYLAVQKEIDARKKLVALIGSKEARKASEDAAKSADSEWQRAADDINRSLTDALLRGFESGKDFAKNLRDTIANMFKTLVLRPIISAVINPISGAITGALGLAGTANAAASGASTLGGIGNLASLGSNLFSRGLGSTISGAIGSGVGALFGTTAGNAALGASLGLGSASSAAAAAGAASAGGASAAGAGLGASIGSAIPSIGLALAAVSLLKGLDDSGTPHTGALSQYSAAGGLASSTTHGAFGMGFGGVDYSAETEKFTGAMAQSIVQMLDSTATTFGKEAGYKAATAFADDTSKDGAWGGLLISKLEETIVNWDPTRTSRWAPKEFADGAAGKEQYLAAVAADVRVALDSIGLPAWATGMLDKLGQGASIEQLAGVVDQINAQVVAVNTLRAAISPMGGIFSSIAAASFDAQSRLISLSGGVDQFLQNAGQFVSQYYSETEQAGVAAVQLATVLEGVGIDLTALGVDTKGEFRALVESLDVNTDAGQEQIAALLQVAPQFAELADFLQKNNMTLEQLADSAPQVSALEKLLSPQEQTAAATAESAELLGNLVGETSRVSSAISGLAASIESSTVNIVVQNQASSNVTVPRFAAGGAHQGGMRLVGENGPEFEFTGPSAIYSTSNSTDMLAAAVERGFIAGAAKSTLSVKSMAPMAAGPKTAEDIFLTNFKDWYPEFADRLNKDTIKQLMNFDLLKFNASGSSVTPELLDTVLKLFEEGFSSDKVNQYVELIRGPNPEGPVTNPNLYLEQFKLRTQWGWTPEQIKAEVQGLATTALDSTLKSLYAGVVSKKDLDQVRQVVGDAGNSMGITQDNLAKLSEAGLLQDYITKDAQGKYSLRASELFSQGGGADGAADGAADAEQQRMNDLLAERRQLEIRLLQAQGKQQEATNLIREDAIKGLSAEAIAIYDSNRALEEQIRVQESLNGFAKESKQLQAQLLQLGGDAAGAKEILRALAIEGLSEVEVAAYDANQALREQIEALNGAKSAAQAALATVEQSVRTEQDRLREKFQAESAVLKERIQGISDVIRTVDSALQSIRGTVAADTGIAAQTAARLTLQSTLTAVRGGADIKGFESVIEQASATLTRNDPNMYATREQYVRAQDQAAGLLQGLNDVGGEQLSAAEQQLLALEEGFNEQIKQLDQVVETARQQLKSMLGIEKTVLSVDAAVKQLDATMAALASAIASAAASNNNNATPIIVDEGPNGNLPWGWGGSDGTAPDVVSSQDQAAIDAYNAWIQTPGAREYQEWVQSLGSELPRYASGGMYAGGLALVGEQGPEIINFRSPGMVYNAGQTSSILGNQELLEEMRAMRKEFIELRVQAQRTADATNGNPESPMLVEVA